MSQPLIIEKNTVIELSRYTSTDKKSNAEYTNKLVTPITVNPNDNIIIKQVFIDNKIIDANSIEIDRDMTVNFQFIYYMIGHGLNLFEVSYDTEGIHFATLPSIGGVDGLPYMLVNQNSVDNEYPSTYGKPDIGQTSIFLKQGIYDRASLADIITRQLQGVNTQATNSYFNQEQTTVAGYITPYYNGDTQEFQNFSAPLLPPPKSGITTTLQKQLYFADLQEFNPGGDSNKFPWDGSLFYIGSNGKPIWVKLVPLADPTQAFYANTYNTNMSTMLVPLMAGLDSEGNPYPGQGISFILPDGTPITVTAYDCGFIGVSEPACLYNETQASQKFSFQLHSPIYQGSNISVGCYISSNSINDDNKISYLQAYSGIMLVNIYEGEEGVSPPDFPEEVELLNLMGFVRTDLIPEDDIPNVYYINNNLIVPDATPKNYFQYSNYLKYTTMGFFPLGGLSTNLSAQVSQMIPYGGSSANYTMTLPSSIYVTYGSDGYQFIESQNSTSVIASGFPISSVNNAGHWLVEINGWLSDYVNEDKIMMVKCLVGNYLYGNGFSQTLGPDSTIYTHNGIPLSLTSLSIRILNPVTKLPPPAYIVGGNSSIYLQIINHNIVDDTLGKK